MGIYNSNNTQIMKDVPSMTSFTEYRHLSEVEVMMILRVKYLLVWLRDSQFIKRFQYVDLSPMLPYSKFRFVTVWKVTNLIRVGIIHRIWRKYFQLINIYNWCGCPYVIIYVPIYWVQSFWIPRQSFLSCTCCIS